MLQCIFLVWKNPIISVPPLNHHPNPPPPHTHTNSWETNTESIGVESWHQIYEPFHLGERKIKNRARRNHWHKKKAKKSLLVKPVEQDGDIILELGDRIGGRGFGGSADSGVGTSGIQPLEIRGAGARHRHRCPSDEEIESRQRDLLRRQEAEKKKNETEKVKKRS